MNPSRWFAAAMTMTVVCTSEAQTGDLSDFAAFQRCFGPEPDALCRIAFDCNDADGQIDLDDYGVFYARFEGQETAPCGMVLIPAGQYLMGDQHEDGDGDELPVHAVNLDAFYMDVYEVTNQQYTDGLNWAFGHGLIDDPDTHAGVVYGSGTSYAYCDTTISSPYSRITWNGDTFGVVTGKENHPMVRVSWYGSVAFCNWRSAMEGRPLCYDLSTCACDFAVAGYRMPTEAEWEKAARGGVAGRRFPWSDKDTIQHARANYYSLPSYSYDTSPTGSYHPTFRTGDFPYTSRVGYFAPNGYGVHDVAGNAWEWCNDWYSSSYYSSSPGSNPTGPGGGSSRVLRGGGWGINASYSRCAHRSSYTPGYRYDRSGLRLALNSE